MDNKKREMCSLERELKLLRPFVQKRTTCRRCYSEEEILAAEQRLNYKLPSPVRFMYLYMADLLFSGHYLRPLELLRWDHDHLGIFPPTEWDKMIGIHRNADPNTLYFWEEEDPEGDSYKFEDKFEECCNYGDECGKQGAAQKYLDYWETLENDPSSSQIEFNSEKYYALLDEYVLFISLHALYEDYEGLAQMACYGKNTENLDLFLEGDLIGCDPVEDLVANIEKRFRPLSDHPELMIGEVPPLCTAYIHPKEQILLIALPGHLNITLLTPKKIAPNVLEEIEHSTGLEFFPAYP